MIRMCKTFLRGCVCVGGGEHRYIYVSMEY